VKIAHVLQNYHPSIGGCQDLFKHLSEDLVTLYGDKVTVLTTNALQSTNQSNVDLIAPDDDLINGVRVYRFRFLREVTSAAKLITKIARRLSLPQGQLVPLLSNGPISPAMLYAFLEIDADIITIASFPYLQMFYPMLGRLLGKKVPIVHYGLLHLEIDRKIARPFLTVIQDAAAYIALTTYERNALVAQGIDASKIHVIGPGVQMDRFASSDGMDVRRKYGIGSNPVVAFIGRQAAYKGIDTLIQAMSSVWKRIPEAYLLIAGSRTSFSERLDRMVADLPVQQRERIILVGTFNEVEKASLYAACDVLASVSCEESFGIVYLEAWASRRPVIGADIGAVRSVIDHEQDGLLVPYGDAEQLGSSIIMLLQDDRRRREFAERGYQKVQGQYTQKIVTAKVRRIYEMVQR
jgi:glycosyltransferase involved in cell wall biosynthesis